MCHAMNVSCHECVMPSTHPGINGHGHGHVLQDTAHGHILQDTAMSHVSDTAMSHVSYTHVATCLLYTRRNL